MDRRKIYLEKEKTLYETLNTDELNLEIAKNIEIMLDLKEIIDVKAQQLYKESRERNKIFTFSRHSESLDDKPKLLYVIACFAWLMAYRRGCINYIIFFRFE